MTTNAAIEKLLLAIEVHGPSVIFEPIHTAALRGLFKRDQDGFHQVCAELEQAGIPREDVMALVEQPTNADLDRSIQDREDEAKITELAQLSGIAYQRRRNEAALELGINVAALDKEVGKKRTELEADDVPMLYPHWVVEPWSERIETGALIESLTKKIRRHVVMSTEQAIAVALWVMLTWVHERAAVHSPILLVTSAEANSGKSTVLGVIGFLARRALLTVSISGPALFRSIDKWQPTFAIDEADTILVDNNDLRDVVNSGWTRGQGVPRCDPETHEPRLYSSFCPKVIGMKGRRLRDTTLSRAIIIEMKRKRPDETAEDFDHTDDAELARLRRQLSRWANDSASTLGKAQPEIPPGFHNRVRANWKLVLAIAESAGDDWKRQAWQAAGVIEGVRATFESSIGVTLLDAMRTMFEPNIECLRSKDVIAKLTDDPEQPWVEYNRGKPITQKQLANLLGQYQIYPDTVHPPDQAHGRGYKRQQFGDAFERYLTPSGGNGAFEVCKCANPTAATESVKFLSVQETNPHTSKSADLSNIHAGLHTCTLRKSGIGEKGGVPPSDDPLELAAEVVPTAVTTPPAAGRTEPATRHAEVEPAQAEPDGEFPAFLRRCQQCRAPGDAGGAVTEHAIGGRTVWLHEQCRPFYGRSNGFHRPQRERLGRPALGPDGDDLGDFK